MQFYRNKQELMMKTLKLQIKKIILTITGILAMGITAFGRPTLPDTNRFFYDFPFSSNLGIRFKNNGKIKSDIYTGLRWKGSRASSKESFRSIIIDGECSVELCYLDINEKNADEYRYRVIKNFNEPMAPWITPSVFKASGNNKVKYAYLGQFNYEPRQILKVEIYDIKYGTLQDAIRIDWKKIEPATIRGFIQFASGGPHFPPDKLVSVEMNILKNKKGKYNTDFIETTSAKNIRFRLGDSLQNLNFNVGGDGPRFYNYRVILKREIKGQTDSVSLGETNTFGETNDYYGLDSFDLNKVYWNSPGKYKLTFIPNLTRIDGRPVPVPDNLTANISFTVLQGNR